MFFPISKVIPQVHFHPQSNVIIVYSTIFLFSNNTMITLTNLIADHNRESIILPFFIGAEMCPILTMTLFSTSATNLFIFFTYSK